ncbi:hypothetical protein GCM10010909_24390 [Acidocella aquatica]|uniref:Secreted protein n=1 Tax=Acidocella aquatica TaxID=1922313 RepID=A0ABQ6AC26_9PROT|nr:hypothetical protein [Acidocella aquatica]GLR67758.1 hypothetical protein GCM10010909_24390 [Acidocella aquatica]
MNVMTAAIFTVAASCALFSASQPAFASGSGGQGDAAIGGLAGMAVSNAQLEKLRGGSFVVSSTNVGIDTGNSANNTTTGNIANTQSINNNTGITTIFENTGNNSLFQSSTTVNISLK